MALTPNDPDAPSPQPRFCPLYDSMMVLSERDVFTVIYTCSPCRVTVQFAAEPLADER